jgi:hypothetical protein
MIIAKHKKIILLLTSPLLLLIIFVVLSLSYSYSRNIISCPMGEKVVWSNCSCSYECRAKIKDGRMPAPDCMQMCKNAPNFNLPIIIISFLSFLVTALIIFWIRAIWIKREEIAEAEKD